MYREQLSVVVIYFHVRKCGMQSKVSTELPLSIKIIILFQFSGSVPSPASFQSGIRTTLSDCVESETSLIPSTALLKPRSLCVTMS